MKKLVLLCFLSIVAMFNSATFAQDCCFWVEKDNSAIPEEVYSLNTPVVNSEDYYYIHFNNTCNLDSLLTKVSIGWEIYRNGQLLGTDLGQFADVYFQINDSQNGHAYGFVGNKVRSGLGNQYDQTYLNNPINADFPGAIPNIGNNGAGYLTHVANAQNYNFFYLHYLQYASRTNGLRMMIKWRQFGVYNIKFTLYERSCGTEIEYPYQPSVSQSLYFGGHQSTVTGIIAQYELKPMVRGSHEAEICAGEIYPFGVQPNGTPYTYTGNPSWPDGMMITAVVPSYIQPTPCYGPAVARMDTLRLTINPIPPVPVVADQEICGEGEVTFAVSNLQDPDLNVTYRWYADAALTTMIAEGNTNTVSILNPSNVTTSYNYYVVAIANGCQSAPAMVTATSNPIPELSLISYNETTCPYIHTEAVGVTVLPGSSTGTLTFAWTGATGTTANATVAILTDCNSEYPFSVLVTDSKGCSNTISGLIVAEDDIAPVVSPLSIIAPTTVGCDLDEVPSALDLNGLISAGFVFTDNCTDPTNGTNFTVQVSREESTLGCTNTLKRYYILYDNCGNPSAEFYMEYNVIDDVAPTYTPNTNIYTAITSANCTFSITQDILDQIAEDFSPVDNCSEVTTTFSIEPGELITTTTNVIVTFTDECENYTTASAYVTVPVTLSSTLTALPASLEGCTGSSFNFTIATENGVEPITYTWNDTELEGNNVTVTPVLDDINTDQDFTYTVTVMDANNCSSINTVTVTVHGEPEFTLTDDLAICFGESTTLVANYYLAPADGEETPSYPANTFLWSNEATTPSITVNPTETTTYTVTITSPYGCTSSQSVTVTVNPLPVFTVEKINDDFYCVGDNGAISILPNDGTYNYFIGSTPITLPFENLPAGTYTITAQNPTSLCSQTAMPVSIIDSHVNPIADLEITEITNHCLYEPITVDLTATSDQENATFVIKVNDLVLENEDGMATYTFTVAGTYTFEVVTTNTVTGCVSSVVSQVVTIYPLPVDPTLTSNDSDICLGNYVTLTASPVVEGYSYQFGTSEPTSSNILTVTPEVVGENTYSVTITTEFGCIATASTTVVVNPLPVVASITAEYECPGIMNPVTPVITGGTAPYTLTWDGNVVVDEELGTVRLANIACGSENLISLSVVDSKGCSAYSSVTITINDVTPPTIVFEGTISPELTVDCSSIPTQRTQDVNVSDNCTEETAIIISMLPEVIIPGTCANTYDIERRWRAQDACGNTNTIMQLIHVVDAVIPELTSIPADLEVSCDEVPEAILTDETLTATDNCTSPSLITFNYVETTGATQIANTYFIYRDWYAVDQCGNQSTTMRQTITVTDEIAPTLITTTLPADLTLACSDEIPAPAVLEYSDNCEGQVIVHFSEVSTKSDDINDAEYYNYTITRNWFATDAAGNATPTTTQVITVQDLVAPTLVENSVPANSIITCDQEIPGIANVMFTDNCDENLEITYDQVSTQGTDPSLASYYNYTLTRTWFATDASGLVSETATEVITVQDISAPTVVETTIPSNITLNCEDEIPSPADVQFVDACDADLTVDYAQESTQGTTPNTYEYYNYTITRTWSATDASDNSSSVITQVITVQDITNPVVVESTIPQDVTLTCYDEIPSMANVLFTDNCSTPSILSTQTSTFVNNPDNIAYYNYQITRTWIATDASGNTSDVVTQVITVVDTEAPAVVSSSIPEDVTVSCGNIPEIPTVQFTDACDAEPVITFAEVSTQSSDYNDFEFYNYTITRTWFATDVTGHVSPTVTQVIAVQDVVSPVVVEATIPENITINCHETVPEEPIVSFTDNCDLYLTISYNEVSTRTSNPATSGYYNYSITRTWFAIDASNNASDEIVQVITVQDVTNPVFTFVPANTTIFTNENCNYETGTSITGLATATDNCYIPSVTFTDVVTEGENAGEVVITRTWRAQDVTGNFVTATQIITVTDNIAPTFTVPANGSVCRNIDGTYNDLVTTDIMGVPTDVNDNCTETPTVSYTDDLSNIGDINTDGYILRTWTVTDELGNSTSATQTIIVNHRPTVVIAGPTTICQNTTITLTASGANSYLWNTSEMTASINVAEAGTYSVVGSLLNGCTNSAEITVTQFEIPTISSTVNDQICVGEMVTLNAEATDNQDQLLNGDWSVQMISGTTDLTTNYIDVTGALVHVTAPVYDNTYFQLTFTDVNGCSYNHTTATTLVTDDPRLRLYTDQTAEPNNILNVTTGQDAKFYIKVEACADLDRRAQIQFQVYKDGVALTDLGQYLTDQYLSVSYFTAQNGITNPNPNNTYYNPIAQGTYPYANTAQYAPWNGFFVSWTTNAYNWFYMHFFQERFITVDINAFSQPGQYTIVYNLIGADASCNITDNSTNYVSSLSYGGSGFQFCNNTILMATNTMTINVGGSSIPSQPAPLPTQEESTSMKVKVYPNPSNGERVRMNFDNIEGSTLIKLVTLNGKVLSEYTTNISSTKNYFELPDLNLAPGVYFIQVINNDAVLTKKLVIQK